ncbi:MAG TPA: 3',5'-cyclic-nucleotide phosphodiesterase [Thermodesulfovibrionales bacterium]|nr:3',5'-cyclic-nucleotide phosphodiesterase [Thermodesulfovibrionales bacterium]
MNIRVIGCSGGELPGHNAPGFLLDDEIVFDAGSITSALSLKAQLRIKHVFITHAHLDHVRSIPFLADNIVFEAKRKKIEIYSISPVITAIRNHLFKSSVWPDFTSIPGPDDAVLNLVKVRAEKPLMINGYSITPYRVSHPVPAVGYLVEDSSGSRFFYTGDTGPTPSTWKKIGNRDIHCIIIDVSFPNALKDTAVNTGHLTPGLLKEELSKMSHLPERICITHPKPQFFKTIKSELAGLRMKNIRVLKDGDIIRI